jgi:hypothetical protein
MAVANVYVDGFNLHYGQLKGRRGVKWLNLETLCGLLLPDVQVKRIRYFTARVRPRPGDRSVHVRQDAYLRALGTLPKVTIHLGHFLTNETKMPLAHPPAVGPTTVTVIKTEEKGSDVNLATYLLVDAFRGDADTFVIVSNDSDLTEPLRIVRHELGMNVGILNPHDVASRALQRCSPTFTKQIRRGALAASQFPSVVRYTKPDGTPGKVRRPAGW